MVEGELRKPSFGEFSSKRTPHPARDTDKAVSNWRTMVLDKQSPSDVGDPSIRTDTASYFDDLNNNHTPRPYAGISRRTLIKFAVQLLLEPHQAPKEYTHTTQRRQPSMEALYQPPIAHHKRTRLCARPTRCIHPHFGYTHCRYSTTYTTHQHWSKPLRTSMLHFTPTIFNFGNPKTSSIACSCYLALRLACCILFSAAVKLASRKT